MLDGNENNAVDQANVQNTPGAEDGVNNSSNVDTNNVNNTQGTNDSNQGEKTFTQNQVSQMMANEKRQGRESVYRELGIDPKNEKQMAMFKAFIESQNVEEDTDEQLSKAEAKFIEAEHKAMIAELKVEAMKLGVQSQYVDDVITLVSAKIGDSEDIDVKSVLTELKSKYPVWFTPDDAQQSTGDKGTGSPVGSSSGNSGSGDTSIGARLAAQRRASNNVKSSFWK